jgi:hypothetical protein
MVCPVTVYAAAVKQCESLPQAIHINKEQGLEREGGGWPGGEGWEQAD